MHFHSISCSMLTDRLNKGRPIGALAFVQRTADREQAHQRTVALGPVASLLEALYSSWC